MIFDRGHRTRDTIAAAHSNRPIHEKSISTRALQKLDKGSASQDNPYTGDKTA
jgi:hypothetical protein